MGHAEEGGASVLEYVAKRIRELRTSHEQGKGLSQEALADGIEVATNTISRWETGTYKPSIEDLERLARFFHVSVLSFFPTENEPEEVSVVRLRKAMSGLREEDIEELEKYAEFRRARNQLAHAESQRPRRKRRRP